MARKNPEVRDAQVCLSEEELRLVIDALDSHAYWQLSDPVYRRDGYVETPGSDTPSKAEEILKSDKLREYLEHLLHATLLRR